MLPKNNIQYTAPNSVKIRVAPRGNMYRFARESRIKVSAVSAKAATTKIILRYTLSVNDVALTKTTASASTERRAMGSADKSPSPFLPSTLRQARNMKSMINGVSAQNAPRHSTLSAKAAPNPGPISVDVPQTVDTTPSTRLRKCSG